MSRPLLRLFGAVGTAAFACAAFAQAALADSEPPPPGTFTESNTGTIVIPPDAGAGTSKEAP